MEMIYYVCPDRNHPSGGIRVIYRHVDILNSNGIEASVLHSKRGFRCTWFENQTRIAYSSKVKLDSCDIFVLPEGYNALYANGSWRKVDKLIEQVLLGDVPKVIFNQNCYNTFMGCMIPAQRSIYDAQGVQAAIVVSEDNLEYLEHAFAGLKVFRVHNSINPDLFNYHADKLNQIAYMPRRHPEDAQQVFNILQSRGVLDGVGIVPIQNMSEADVAATLKKSRFFFSFGYPEGFGLPPAEAMACGCVVVGYHGMGGREFYDPGFSYPVQVGNIIDYAKVAEHVILAGGAVYDKGRRAAEFIAKNYSPNIENECLIDIWNNISFGRN